MKKRVISGLIMLPLLAVVYVGGDLLLLCLMAVSIIGLKEFYGAFNELSVKGNMYIGTGFTLLLYLSLAMNRIEDFLLPMLFAMIFISFVTSILSYDKSHIWDPLVTITGVVYISFLSIHLGLLQMTEAPVLIWLSILTAFGTDIFAFFSGYFFGKHKLLPKVSPKKTVEGSLGGIVGSILLSAVFMAIFSPELIVHGLIIGAVGSFFAQAGDLTASFIKRKTGIKDFGTLIPGHGGVLDRFDSILFTAPFVYYYSIFILG